MELGQNAVVHATPAVVLDVEIVRRNELTDSWSEDRADDSDNRLLGSSLVAEGDDHGPLGRQMALIDSAGDVLLGAEEVEIDRRVGVLHGGVPFVGPSHGYSDGILGFDADVHIASTGCGMVHAAAVQASGFHRDGFVVGGRPVEDAMVLRARDRGESADQQRGEDAKIPHSRSIYRVQAAT